jgi:hypothetical protein
MGNRTRLPDMTKKWRPWAEAEAARAEAQRFIERWNTALASGRDRPVWSGEYAVSDLHIIAKRGRQFASIIANSPEGERWIKASFSDKASAAAFNPEFLQEFCLRIVLDGVSLKVTLTEAECGQAQSFYYLGRDRGVLDVIRDTRGLRTLKG